MLTAYNAKLVEIPRDYTYYNQTQLTVGHNPVYREFGTVEESVGENCPEEDD